jgi:uncharacterized coiled-coil protein SlyX
MNPEMKRIHELEKRLSALENLVGEIVWRVAENTATIQRHHGKHEAPIDTRVDTKFRTAADPATETLKDDE